VFVGDVTLRAILALQSVTIACFITLPLSMIDGTGNRSLPRVARALPILKVTLTA
jgi:hypothetical protein